VLIVGLRNEISKDPDDALEPYTPNGSGERLYEMVREQVPITKHEYCNRFIFVNLLGTGGKSPTLVKRLTAESKATVVCGLDAWRLLEMPKSHFWIENDIRTYLIPHPSGKNQVYNSDIARRRTGLLLARLAEITG
jgi:hypothetical protein